MEHTLYAHASGIKQKRRQRCLKDNCTRSVMGAPPTYLPLWAVNNRYIPSHAWQPSPAPQAGVSCQPMLVSTPCYSSNSAVTTTWPPAPSAQTSDALAPQATITGPPSHLACPPDSNYLSRVTVPSDCTPVSDLSSHPQALLYGYHPYQLSMTESVDQHLGPRASHLNANVTEGTTCDKKCTPSGDISGLAARTD